MEKTMEIEIPRGSEDYINTKNAPGAVAVLKKDARLWVGKGDRGHRFKLPDEAAVEVLLTVKGARLNDF